MVQKNREDSIRGEGAGLPRSRRPNACTGLPAVGAAGGAFLSSQPKQPLPVLIKRVLVFVCFSPPRLTGSSLESGFSEGLLYFSAKGLGTRRLCFLILIS